MHQMDKPDYTYSFEGIADRLRNSPLHIIDHQTGAKHTIKVSVDDRDFLKLRGRQVPSRIADLIDLAVAIYEGDRWSQRRHDEPCKIFVQLPVRNPEVWNAVNIHEVLQRLLYWYTGDIWAFKFVQFDQDRRLAELQRTLWKPSYGDARVEVALWSGGLDSLAGLCNRIAQNAAEQYLLFGAGGNIGVQKLQKQVANAITRRLPKYDINLTQLPIRQDGTKPLRLDRNLRARGLVFMLLGGAFALLEDQHQLAIYENGIGAINLPFRASEVGLDHARSVHPLSLLYLGDFVSLISQERFTYHNPFLFSTKAEMCSVLNELDVIDIAWTTISCDRCHRKQTAECGRCSSCLLRRQALLGAGLGDDTKYLIHVETEDILYRLLRKSHLPAMLFQVRRWQQELEQPNAWELLARQHPTLLADLVMRSSFISGEGPEELINNLLSLLRRYTKEWTINPVRGVFDDEMEIIKRTPKRATIA